MKILHTEASKGWGGQEIRILREAEGMRERGWEIIFVTSPGAQLAIRAREKNFFVQEIPMEWKYAPISLWELRKLIKNQKVNLVVTHSSMDAWLGGISARLAGCPVVRLRHLSTPIKKGLNSKILYNYLANYTVTTCQSVANIIRNQANLPPERCFSVPTGMDPKSILVQQKDIEDFRKKWNLHSSDFIVGCVCVMRSWKGIADLLKAAHILKEDSSIKWLLVGGGAAESYFRGIAQSLNLNDRVLFTGHLEDPYPALSLMNVFALLSTANEGVSQASLQAAFLKKPLITTKIGGLPEVCIEGKNGFHVAINDPKEVATAISKLKENPQLRLQFGEWGYHMVMGKFTFTKTLNEMESLYRKLI